MIKVVIFDFDDTLAGLHFIALLESGLKTEDDFKDIKVDLFAKMLPEILPYILQH